MPGRQRALHEAVRRDAQRLAQIRRQQLSIPIHLRLPRNVRKIKQHAIERFFRERRRERRRVDAVFDSTVRALTQRVHVVAAAPRLDDFLSRRERSGDDARVRARGRGEREREGKVALAANQRGVAVAHAPRARLGTRARAQR